MFAIVIALVGLLLLGQAIGRQVGRESHDAGQLRALGLTRNSRSVAQAAGLRWVATGIVAAVVGVAIMFAASPIAPIGLARKTIADPSLDLAVAIALVIAIGTLVAITLGGAWSAWRSTKRSSSRLPSSALAIHAVRPTASTGIAATLQSLRRPLRTNAATALGAIVLVATAAIASAAVVQSYDRLLDRPPQFGAPWDAVVGNNSNVEEAKQTVDRLSRIECGTCTMIAARDVRSTEAAGEGAPRPTGGSLCRPVASSTSTRAHPPWCRTPSGRSPVCSAPG